MTIGILALQGDVAEHAAALEELGTRPRLVRRPADLEGLSGVVLPGGESTTLSLLLESSELFDALADALGAGLPAFGTCAGLVLLADRVLDGRADQRSFGAVRCTVRRNGYGRQAQSFEADLDASKVAAELGTDDDLMHAVFIRAPVIEEVDAGVEVLARFADRPVVCRQGHILVAAFHPELTPDRRLHRLFAQMCL
jgi:5'-phosphate synthase pdxT subunit